MFPQQDFVNQLTTIRERGNMVPNFNTMANIPPEMRNDKEKAVNNILTQEIQNNTHDQFKVQDKSNDPSKDLTKNSNANQPSLNSQKPGTSQCPTRKSSKKNRKDKMQYQRTSLCLRSQKSSTQWTPEFSNDKIVQPIHKNTNGLNVENNGLSNAQNGPIYETRGKNNKSTLVSAITPHPIITKEVPIMSKAIVRPTAVGQVSIAPHHIPQGSLSQIVTPVVQNTPLNPAPAPSDEEETIPSANDQNPENTERFPARIYGLIQRKENMIDANIRCEICLDSQAYDDDSLVVCEMCLSAVHQSWYGQDLLNGVPEGDWFWQRWQFLIDQQYNSVVKVKKVFWSLCHDTKGIIIHTNSPYGWVHHTWVNWIPELYFDEDSDFKLIHGRIDNERKSLKCNLCKRPGGYWIQWDFRDCSHSFHVSWAIKNNLIKDWKFWDEMARDNTTPIFWKRHEKIGYKEFTTKGVDGIKPDYEKIERMRKKQEERLEHIEGNIQTKRKVKHVMLKFSDDENYEVDEETKDDDNEEYKEIKKPVSKPRNRKRKRLAKNYEIAKDKSIDQGLFNWNILKECTNILVNNNGIATSSIMNQISNLVQQEGQKGKNILNRKTLPHREEKKRPIRSIPIPKKKTAKVKKQTINVKKQTRPQKAVIPDANKRKSNRLAKAQSNSIQDNQSVKIDQKCQYFVDPKLARIIKMDQGTMKDINAAFIEYALEKNLVNTNTHNYEIFKDYTLKEIFKVNRFKSIELSKVLQSFMTKEALVNENNKDGVENGNETQLNRVLPDLGKSMNESQSRNLKLLKKMTANMDNFEPDFNLDVVDIDLDVGGTLNGVDQQVINTDSQNNKDVQQVSVREPRNYDAPEQINGTQNYANLTKDQLIQLLMKKKG